MKVRKKDDRGKEEECGQKDDSWHGEMEVDENTKTEWQVRKTSPGV